MDTSKEATSLVHLDLQSFFGDLLKRASSKAGLSASEQALDYVSEVLVSFQHSQSFFSSFETRLPILSDILSEAVEADLYRKISLYRRLGDTSLMVSGVFDDAIKRRTVSVDYYHQMGEIAYSYLRDLVETNTVFEELSEDFVLYVNLVQSVFQRLRLEELSMSELLAKHAAKPSLSTLEKLKEQGVFPIDRKSED